jgi:A/G-specific adenine glycosylase
VAILEANHTLGGLNVETLETLPILKHTFSHYHLEITPVLCRVIGDAQAIAESTQVWYKSKSNKALSGSAPIKIGLAAPVKKLMELYS